MGKFYFQKQYDSIDCGPACLKMVAAHFGKHYSFEFLREQCYLTKEGVSLLSINDAAEKIGFRTLMAFVDENIISDDAPLPCILHWNQNHFVVLYAVKRSLFSRGEKKFIIGDPAHGIVRIDRETFDKLWISGKGGKGTVLFLEPMPAFFKQPLPVRNKLNIGFLYQYIRPYKKMLAQLVIGMIAASIITLTFPVLTQILIDKGVSAGNTSLVLLMLASQVFLFFGNTVIDIVRSWLLLHINARVSLNIISDFLIKLLKLPIRYFDTRAVGDISQRINDHHRIENFLTGESINSVFSVINILTFIFALVYYNWLVLLVFLAMSIFGLVWIFLFQNRRKQLDYKRFSIGSENQDKLVEMINGMQEIKLNGSETFKRWEWEKLQVTTFRLNIKSLALEQYQHVGFMFFTHLKNIIISYIAARETINGHLTLGGMLSISYIIGQTNGPLDQLVSLIKTGQDARLSIARLQEIHLKKNEEDEIVATTITDPGSLHDDIFIRDLSFQYEGPNSPFVLKSINLTIPRGRVTAIVGTSGSGKTTLMKLLLNFYPPVKGTIHIGEQSLASVSPKIWRSYCGTVMQDGYIFYDTIAGNIALDGKEIDECKMTRAMNVSNLKEFVDGLPLGYTTKIGSSGVGISGGQRQRILIARAVYKDPEYLFFDEATSSLDANNERIIMDNLNDFFKGKTVVIIAHRLSTVKNADQVIVLHQGKIVEMGRHHDLVKVRGHYFELVKNQLELGD